MVVGNRAWLKVELWGIEVGRDISRDGAGSTGCDESVCLCTGGNLLGGRGWPRGGRGALGFGDERREGIRRKKPRSETTVTS